MDSVYLILSIFSTVVALMSLYFSRFKMGKLAILPLKIYIAQPLNSQGRRLVQLITSLTLSNTGAVSRAIFDLRVKIKVEKHDLILDWIHEYSQISLTSDIGAGNFPTQPTLQPYESIARVYGFQSSLEGADAVDEMEKHEEAKCYPAWIECRNEKGQWKPLLQFKVEYNGRRKWELEYSKIND